VADRRQESRPLAPDLRRELHLPHLFLQSQAVDTGGESGDERLEQLPVRRRERFPRDRQQRDARRVDAHVRGRERALGNGGGRTGGESARVEGEQLRQRVRRASERVVDVGPREQPVRELEPDPRLVLTSLRGTAQR